jgi:hypothetical protein
MKGSIFAFAFAVKLAVSQSGSNYYNDGYYNDGYYNYNGNHVVGPNSVTGKLNDV